MAADILTLPLDEGLDVVGTTGIVFGAGTALAAGLGFALRSTAGALITVFLLVLLLPLALPQFPYDWMIDLASVLPGTGAIFLLTGESIGEDMTRGSAIATMLAWAGVALALGWLRLVRDDANR
jgi:ABC-2 type transport system permease protein